MGFNLTPPMKMLIGLAAAFAMLNIAIPIYLLIFGSTAQTALSGAVAVPIGVNRSINLTIASVTTGITRIQTAANFVLGLASLVTLMLVFKPVIGDMFAKKGEKGGNSGGGSGGFMG